MLRVVDLTCDGRSPLWATSEDELLGEAISTTLTVLQRIPRRARRGRGRLTGPALGCRTRESPASWWLTRMAPGRSPSGGHGAVARSAVGLA